MSLVTLTTDFGELDYYVPSFKGSILRSCPSVKIVDVTHKIPAFNINIAAYIVKNSFQNFPENTIHIVRVGEKNSDAQKIVAVSYHGHYFIGPNNGVLSMIFDETPMMIIGVDKRMINLPNLDEYYCRVIKHLIFKGNIGEIGAAITDFKELNMLKAGIYPNAIRGMVVHIDSFGNCITNITKEDFENGVGNKKYVINYRRLESISRISEDYDSVEVGDRLAKFNSKDFLELAVNEGNAGELLGISFGDLIQIEVL